MISCIYYGTVNFPPIESLLHTERFAMRYENENESNSIQSPHANVKQWVENICFQVSPKRKKNNAITMDFKIGKEWRRDEQ